MIVDVIEKFSSIIKNYHISKFRTFETSHEIIGKITLIDNTELLFREYLFPDSLRKYSYHWQQKNTECIVRWDNAPHHQETATFPHHKHCGEDEQVFDAEPMTLEKSLTFVSNKLQNK